MVNKGPRADTLGYLDGEGRFVSDDIPEIPDVDLVSLYELMLTIRALEERMVKLQRQGRIGFYIGTRGEEATHVGAAYALRSDDIIFPAYREVGPALYRGYPLQGFVDQLFGNADDSTKGRQMPNHHSAKGLALASISSPVGTQIPQCTGTAWAARIRGSDQVSLCFFGEGTSSEGDFHVGLNFAAVFKLPAIFVLRNNGWAISEPASMQSATETFHVKAKAYGMPGIRVDGNDLYAMVQAVREAAERGRRGDGPTLIEAVTYRLGPHSTSDDPSKYREASAVSPHEPAEPMRRLRAVLRRKELMSEAQESEYVAVRGAEILQIVRDAEAKARPALDSLFDDVYAELPWHLRRQREQARALQQSA